MSRRKARESEVCKNSPARRDEQRGVCLRQLHTHLLAVGLLTGKVAVQNFKERADEEGQKTKADEDVLHGSADKNVADTTQEEKKKEGQRAHRQTERRYLDEKQRERERRAKVVGLYSSRVEKDVLP